MEVYTYFEARQKLSSILDEAEIRGKILIRRKDGRTFALVPERMGILHWTFPPSRHRSRRMNSYPWSEESEAEQLRPRDS